jgi:hypothetical protein
MTVTVYASSGIFVRALSPVIVQAQPGRLPQVSAAIMARDLTRILSFGPFKNIRPWAGTALSAARAIPSFNMHAAVLDAVTIASLAEDPDVAAIYDDSLVRISQFPTVPPAGTWSVQVAPVSGGTSPETLYFTSTDHTRSLLGADSANAAGFTGSGVLACVVDTGGHHHPQTLRAAFRTAIPGNVGDTVSHGLWCLSALGGVRFYDSLFSSAVGAPVFCQGMAPGASLLAVKGLDFVIGTAPTSVLLSALEIALQAKVDVLSLSWGGALSVDTPAADPFYQAMSVLDQAGVLIFAAAGNSGAGTLDSPGALPQPVTVGAYNAVGNSFSSMFGPAGSVCNFSGGMTTPWGDIKPDCVAPGAIIDSGVSPISEMAVSYTQRPHAAQAIAGCVHEDGLVWLTRGAVPIRDVVPGDCAWGFDGNGTVSVRVALNLRKGVRETVTVRSESRSVCVTPNHPLLVARLASKEPDPGDFTATARESNAVLGRKGFSPLDQAADDRKRLAEMYPTADWAELHAAFPNWSRDWMRHVASELGVRRGPGTEKKAPEIRFVWTRAGDLRRGDVLVYPRQQPATGRTAKVAPGFARLLGFMVGDGWTAAGSYQTAFALSKHEDLNERYLDLFEKVTGKRPVLSRDVSQAYVYSKRIWRTFRALGMGDKAAGKHTPAVVWRLGTAGRREYVAGLFDADGYEGDHRSGLEMCNHRLVAETHNLAMMLGEHVGNVRHRVRRNAWAERRGRGKSDAESWAFDIYPSPVRVGSDSIPPWAARRFPELVFDTIVDVRPSGRAFVHDLVIDDVHNFVAEGTFAHNTSMATPQAAGLGVLMRQAHRQLLGKVLTNTEFKAMLQALGGQSKNSRTGWGMPTWSMYGQWVESQYGVTVPGA